MAKRQATGVATRLKQRSKRWLRNPAVLRLLALMIRAYLALVLRTSRIEAAIDPQTQQLIADGQGALAVASHGRILLLPALYVWLQLPLPLFALHSGHRDGQLVGAVARAYRNLDTIEGSSSRGGAQAIRQIQRAVRAPAYVLITPDGPRGPRLRNRSAVASLAQQLDVPLVPVAVSSRRGRFLDSWDRFLLVWPFDRIELMIGAPVPLDGRDPAADNLLVEQRLIALTQLADRKAGRVAIEPA